MGCVLRGRSKALGVEGHLRQVGIQGYGRLPYGYPVGYHVDTLWIPYGIPCGYPMGYHVEYHVEYPMGYIVET